MKSLGLSAVIAVAFILLPTAILPASAATFLGGTNAWTLVGQPAVKTLNGNPTAEANYQNNLNETTLGIVFLVAYNSLHQTVYFTAGTTNVAAGANSTAFLPIFGLQSGTYSVTIFSSLPSGTAISLPTTITVSI